MATPDPRPPRADERTLAPGREVPRTDRPHRGPERERDADRDLLSRPPGAHRVGVSAGAAAGGAAGALIGAAAGPVGAVVGGALGAVAGGYIGREAAEAVNPTVEDRYWSEAYASRPYVIKGETYEYYRPAYHFGWESYRRHAAAGEPRAFDELSPTLAAAWANTDASATLPWERARPAARDAWNRVARQGFEDAIMAMEHLRRTCTESARGFRAAADELEDPAFVDLVESWAQQREGLAEELAAMSGRLGGEPGDPGESGEEGPSAGELHDLWIHVRDASMNGPHAILSECERGEDLVVREYEDALAQRLPPVVEAVLRRQHQVILVTHEQVRSLRDAAAGG